MGATIVRGLKEVEKIASCSMESAAAASQRLAAHARATVEAEGAEGGVNRVVRALEALERRAWFILGVNDTAVIEARAALSAIRAWEGRE